ncbi:cadherin-like domain-containing protein [Niabella sp. 22666]|uniref:cadherin-like domain-containing protein n=1 Tax=Niabella sp. 22666 TaxID=3453954 RepID=UPI003F82682E
MKKHLFCLLAGLLAYGFSMAQIVVNPSSKTSTIAEDDATTLSTAASPPGNINNLLSGVTSNAGSVVINSFNVNGVTTTAGNSYIIGGVGTITINSNGSYAFTPVLDYNGTVPTITIAIADGAGNTASRTLVITVTPINDRPINTIPSYTTTEDVPLKLTGISVKDADADNGVIHVSFWLLSDNPLTFSDPTRGTLTASPAMGVGINGSGTDSITLIGTMADINAYMANTATQPVYMPLYSDMHSGCLGPVVIKMTTNDLGNTGGNPRTDITGRVITIEAQADITAESLSVVTGTPFTFNVITGTNGANADNFETSPASLVQISRINNDTLITDGTIYTDASGNQLTANKDGSMTFIAAPGFTGSTTFTYSVKPGGGCLETANITINVTKSLPVHFGSINAEIKNGNLSVQWESLSEKNNDHYEIEVSENGVDFVSVGTLRSAAPDGNSDITLQYGFSKDLAATTGLLGISLFSILLVAGFFDKRKTRLMILAVVTITGLFIVSSCNKKSDLVEDQPSKLFVRIAQVDKDGTTTYSKTVQAVIKY